MNYKLYLLYKILCLDDLNTNKNLKNVLCDKFVIIHSPEDKLIKYSQALKNYKTLNKLNKKVKFITDSGIHRDTKFLLK